MKAVLVRSLSLAALFVSSQAMADAMFYRAERFEGASFSAQRRVAEFDTVFGTDRDGRDRGRDWGRDGDQNHGRDDDRGNDRGNDRGDDRRDDRGNDGRNDHANHDDVNDDHRGDHDRGRGHQGRRVGASSAVVFGERWEVCDAADFRGRCMVLRPGRYGSTDAMGLRSRVASARSLSPRGRIDDARYAPMPVSVYDNRRRRNERLYEADVTSARAVYGVEERRCWIEREQVQGERAEGNRAGAVVGAILGGILGHQVGHGSTRDVATVGGAIAGGAVGYNVGRTRNGEYQRDVQRCSASERSSRPDYWAVTYVFRGQEHAMQVAYDPGDTVTVNRRGEPRADTR